jgi:hypothetical protein
MRLVPYILLLIPALLQSWLAVLLVRRSIHRRFPVFFTYTIFSILAAVTLLVVQRNPWAYFYAYWIAEALYALLGFFAICEAFYRVFWHFFLMWWWFKFLLPSVGILMLALSVVEGIFFPPVQAPPLLATIFVAEMAVRCLQGGVFFLFIMLVWFHSLPWQNYAFGIALGFATSGFSIFVTFVLRSKFGTGIVKVIQFVPPVAYIATVGIWLAAFLRPEPPDPLAGHMSPLKPDEVVRVLERLTQQVKGIFKRCWATFSY